MTTPIWFRFFFQSNECFSLILNYIIHAVPDDNIFVSALQKALPSDHWQASSTDIVNPYIDQKVYPYQFEVRYLESDNSSSFLSAQLNQFSIYGSTAFPQALMLPVHNYSSGLTVVLRFRLKPYYEFDENSSISTLQTLVALYLVSLNEPLASGLGYNSINQTKPLFAAWYDYDQNSFSLRYEQSVFSDSTMIRYGVETVFRNVWYTFTISANTSDTNNVFVQSTISNAAGSAVHKVGPVPLDPSLQRNLSVRLALVDSWVSFLILSLESSLLF